MLCLFYILYIVFSTFSIIIQKSKLNEYSYAISRIKLYFQSLYEIKIPKNFSYCCTDDNEYVLIKKGISN